MLFYGLPFEMGIDLELDLTDLFTLRATARSTVTFVPQPTVTARDLAQVAA